MRFALSALTLLLAGTLGHARDERKLDWVKAGSANWQARDSSVELVYKDRLWILGGWSNHPGKNWNDVWYSKDGRQWTQIKSDVIWKERHEHSTYVFQDKIWVTGGHAKPLNNEVWTLEMPPGWFGH